VFRGVDVLAQPVGNLTFAQLTRGHREHQVHGLIAGDFEAIAVERKKDRQGLPCEPLVSVGQRVVAGDANDQHRCLLSN